MQYLRFFLLSCTLIASQSFADSFDFALSNRLITANYTFDLSKSFEVRTDFFHSKVNNTKINPRHASSFKEETSSNFISAGLYNHGHAGPVELYIGGDIFWLRSDVDNVDTADAGGLAIGAQLDATLIPKLVLSTSLNYAPDILTTGDFKSLLKFDLRLSYQVINSTSIYIAYRYLNTWGKDFDARLYNGPLLGVNFQF